METVKVFDGRVVSVSGITYGSAAFAPERNATDSRVLVRGTESALSPQMARQLARQRRDRRRAALARVRSILS